MADQLKTCGSAGLRVMFMNDEKGKLIAIDTLFENLQEFWTSYHDSAKINYYWYFPKIRKLENTIRRKWKSTVLPNVNIFIKKFIEKDEFLNPIRFLEEFNQEKYFKLLKSWKEEEEESYLEKYPHLRFDPIRHTKCVMNTRRPCIR